MKDLQNKIDKAFTDKLAHFEREPSEELWASIKAELHRSYPRETGSNGFLNFYALLGTGLATLTLGAYLASYYYMGNDTGLSAEKVFIPSQTATEEPAIPNPDFNISADGQKVKAPVAGNTASRSAMPSPSKGNNSKKMFIPPSSEFTISSNDDYKGLELKEDVLSVEYINDQYIIDGLSDSSVLRVVKPPKNGQVILDKAGKFNYKPNKGFSGVDSFTYIIQYSDGTRSSEGLIKINVEPETSCAPDFDFELMQGNRVRFQNKSPVVLSNKSFNSTWNFGDGETASTINPEHTYAKGGTYTVCLKIDMAGCSRQSCRTVTLYNNKDSLDEADAKPQQAAKNYEVMGLQNKPIVINMGGRSRTQSLRRAIRRKGVENVLLSDSAKKKQYDAGRSVRDFAQEEAIEPNDRPRSDFSFSAFYIPEHTYRAFRNNAVDEIYRNIRDSSEKGLTGHTTGAGIEYMSGDHLLLSSGLSWTRKGERIDYTVSRQVNNDTTYIIQSKTTNMYDYYRIPFMVGYLIESGQFRFALSAGIAANILSRGKAVILNKDKDNLLLLNEKDMHSVCLSYLGEFTTYFSINNTLSVFIRPAYHRFLTSQTKLAFAEQFPYAYGIGGGINCKF